MLTAEPGIELQMSLLLFVALAWYPLAARIHQSVVVGAILVGIAIGPSGLGWITYTTFGGGDDRRPDRAAAGGHRQAHLSVTGDHEPDYHPDNATLVARRLQGKQAYE